MKFVNRQAEISYLFHYFTSEPNALLFVYGPKSSGKRIEHKQGYRNPLKEAAGNG